MFDFISSQLILYATFVLTLFVPGVFLLLATGLHKKFSLLESFVLAFSSSIVIIDFLAILIGRSPLHITRTSLLLSIAIFAAACYAIFYRRNKKNGSANPISSEVPQQSMSRKSTILVVILLFLTIFIKTIYLKDAVFPTATDLGHHMYWAKQITITGELPIYEKAEISTAYTLEKPTPIADFIIGEHLIFAAIAMLSGADFLSSFPVLTLLLIHILYILALFVLTRSLFKNSPHQDSIAIAALLLAGPLYSIASPQAKFVSGGVIGNNIGNLLIPVLIFLYIKALSEKKSSVLAYALFISLGLAYTHHLSTFVFIFISLFTIAFYALVNFKTLFSDLKGWMQLLVTREVLSVLTMGIIFIFLFYTPTYLNVHAVDTAVGAPSKASRAGLTLSQLKSTAGEARFAFAIVGMILLFFARKLGKYNQAFILGWMGALTAMSLFPDWLLLDIPSNRIASYIVFPAAIIAAYVLVMIFMMLKSEKAGRNFISPVFLFATFFILTTFIATNGFYDNAMSLNSESSSAGALQTYAASRYLGKHSSSQDMILKDHNYLSGDAWIKLFFMRGYNYPLSRGFFKRYQDETKPREQCTNFMISLPNSAEARKCFAGTGTNFVMVDPKMDSAQFHRLDEFWQVYSADAIEVFYKKT